jgi:Phage capsid family
MPTASQLVRSIENDLDVSRDSLTEAENELRGMLDAAESAGRESLSGIENQRAEFLYGDIRRMRAAVKRQESRLRAAQEVADDEARLEERLNVSRKTNLPTSDSRTPSRTTSVSVTRNERTYHPGRDEERGLRNSPGGAFLLDVAGAAMGDYAAQERLMRHTQEMRVDRPWLEERANSGTVNFGGLVVPQYAVEDAAPAVSAARPLADVMTNRTLPQDGMSVNVSRITTPTSAAVQATENTAVSTQAIDDTLLTLPVETAAGYVQLSRQAVERGTLTEDITVADLLTRVAVALENQMISEATVGLAASATGQTYTNATVDTTAVPTFLKQLPQAQSAVDTALQSRTRPCVVVMAPRRFNWITAASSSTWPVLSGVSTPVQSTGLQLSNDYGPAVRAVMANGMRVVVDANVTTVALGTALSGGTQDHVYVISAQESYLYEPPQRTVLIRAEQPSSNQLGVLFTAYEYFAYTFSRYPSQSILVNGTGLASPTFA